MLSTNSNTQTEERKQMAESKEFLCYCGLYCKMCSLINGLPQAAQSLHQIMSEDGWEHFGEQVYPEFPEFWKTLSTLKDLDKASPNCKAGCGDPGCQIRQCAEAKGLEVCAFCEEFPCTLIQNFSRRYPFLIRNNERIRELGLEAWIQEMDTLVAAGHTHKSMIKSSE